MIILFLNGVIIECTPDNIFWPSEFRIRTELSSGVEYWALERKLCHALISKRKVLTVSLKNSTMDWQASATVTHPTV